MNQNEPDHSITRLHSVTPHYTGLPFSNNLTQRHEDTKLHRITETGTFTMIRPNPPFRSANWMPGRAAQSIFSRQMPKQGEITRNIPKHPEMLPRAFAFVFRGNGLRWSDFEEGIPRRSAPPKAVSALPLCHRTPMRGVSSALAFILCFFLQLDPGERNGVKRAPAR